MAAGSPLRPPPCRPGAAPLPRPGAFFFLVGAPERDRDWEADCLFDREVPDPPAGRLVAVVTVRHRLLPLGGPEGDTGRAVTVRR